ncbi:MAG: hypothetical protein Q4G03_10335 [Planctomycetia bacterium]|nr:hypothetical protein [Planctomycetia bacterium]
MAQSLLYRGAILVTLLAFPMLTHVAKGQDSSAPLSVPSIRPFQRSEIPANQAPNLYDPTSDQFDYFRKELGRKELSTRQKNRIADRASRVVYDDPMDKPAWDGSPFVNIYAPENVFADGVAFIGQDDPDVIYGADENNFLAKIAESFENVTTIVGLAFGTAGNNRNTPGMANSSSYDMMGSTPPDMPSITSAGTGSDLNSMGETYGPGGSSAGSKGNAPVKDSNKNDSKIIFPDGDVENPFAAEKVEPAKIAELFKADREFEPKATSAGAGGYGYGSGNATEGMGGSEMMFSKPVVEP